MKDEIKEILEFDFQSQGERIEINKYERNILKDYITNLQEELEITQEKWDKDKQFSNCRTMEMLDYKSRCKRAIEYINTHYLNANEPELLNILKGSDEE